MKKQIGIIKGIEKPAYYDRIVSAAKSIENTQVNEIEWEKFNLSGNDVVLFPESASVPFGAGEKIDAYLKQGGNLITFGGPPATEILHKTDKGWFTRNEITAEEGRYAGRPLIWDFEKPEDAEGWGINAHKGNNPHRIAVGDYASPDSKGALNLRVEDYSGWDLIQKPVNLSAGYENIGFYVRGDKNTTGLQMSLTEKDGSLWIAVFGISEEWKFISLPRHRFAYWFDNPSTGRGFPGDKVNYENVATIGIGWSHSHTGTAEGNFEIWMDSVCQLNEEIPEIDGFSPQWKFYPITNGARTETFKNQCVVSDRSYHLPKKLFSSTSRAQATGFGKGRKERFIPLIEVYDEKNLHSGSLAWMLVNETVDKAEKLNPYEGSIIAGFGTSDPEFYDENGTAAVAEMTEFIVNKKMFIEAGATEYLYIDSETDEFTVGANLCREFDGQSVKMDLFKDGEVILSRSYENPQTSVSEVIKTAEYKPDAVTFTLLDNGKEVDRISHEIVFWSPKPLSERKYITTGNNEFLRDGKPIRMFGVSYMPTSNLAFSYPKGGYDWEHYQSLSSYDPDVCRSDIKRIKDIGFNAIALYVYYDVAMQTKNILHLLNMCDEAGLIVDFALRSYFPLEHDPSDRTITEIIKVLHLDELDYISGYDIGWEQCVGRYIGCYGSITGGRRMIDGDWIKWTEKKYGSVENAEKAWGRPMPKTPEGAYTCPSDAALEVNFEIDPVVNAYRAFIDEFVAEKHNVFRSMIRSVDPYHLISARTNYSGIPLFQPGTMSFDFKSLAPAFDYMSPECYVGKDIIYRNVFTNIYARYAKPGAPVVWKEFGLSSWAGSNFDEFADRSIAKSREKQAEFVEEFFKTVVKAHTGAIYFWFFPGGYRPFEFSDHGSINPDGSDRAVTTVLRRWRNAFIDQPELGEPEVIFEINRDEHPSGIAGIYLEIEKELHKAVDEGKTVAFIDAKR